MRIDAWDISMNWVEVELVGVLENGPHPLLVSAVTNQALAWRIQTELGVSYFAISVEGNSFHSKN